MCNKEGGLVRGPRDYYCFRPINNFCPMFFVFNILCMEEKKVVVFFKYFVDYNSSLFNDYIYISGRPYISTNYSFTALAMSKFFIPFK